MLTESWRDDAFEYHREYFRIIMAQLATNLGKLLSPGRLLTLIADRTGIDGAWDVILDETAGDLSLSTISASLEKQGLHRERTTVPVQKLTVDNIDKTPTEN